MIRTGTLMLGRPCDCPVLESRDQHKCHPYFIYPGPRRIPPDCPLALIGQLVPFFWFSLPYIIRTGMPVSYPKDMPRHLGPVGSAVSFRPRSMCKCSVLPMDGRLISRDDTLSSSTTGSSISPTSVRHSRC